MSLEEFLREWHSDSQTVLVHTSGSTGKPKPMCVEKRRMEASARVTCDFLGLTEGETALLCLPLDYIAGKMMVVRSLVRGMRLISVEPAGTPRWEGSVDLAAMVPLQVWNLLQTADGRQRLQNVRHLIIGGGAIDDGLAAELRCFPNSVWSTYGMTETLSHIALRRLNGSSASEWYTPFAGVSLRLNADGCLVIDAPAVHDGELVTNDIAELQPGGTGFRILGRRDNIICSGGLKIQAEEVERLLSGRLAGRYIVTRCRDARLGEAVVLLTEDGEAEAEAVCRRVLPRHWCPRRFLHVGHIPMTATGKPARREAESLAEWSLGKQ